MPDVREFLVHLIRDFTYEYPPRSGSIHILLILQRRSIGHQLLSTLVFIARFYALTAPQADMQYVAGLGRLMLMLLGGKVQGADTRVTLL